MRMPAYYRNLPVAQKVQLAGMVVGPPERLQDRALARLRPRRALEDDRGLRVVARLDQRLAALEERVGALVLGVLELGHALDVRTDRGPERPRIPVAYAPR